VTYQLMFVGDADLPEGVDWAAARGDLGGVCLFVKLAACPLGVAPAGALRAARSLAADAFGHGRLIHAC
jgi:hypothetical protein